MQNEVKSGESNCCDVPDASLKLLALCEGLEIQHIDKLLSLGQVGDFRRLGEIMAERIREIKHNKEVSMESFEKELTELLNRHSIENVADMPDFLLAGMICRIIEAMGPSVKKTLDWYGVDSVCHPAPNMKGEGRDACAGKEKR